MDQARFENKTERYKFETVAEEYGVKIVSHDDRLSGIRATYLFDTPAFCSHLKDSDGTFIKRADVLALHYHYDKPQKNGCAVCISYSGHKEIVLRFPDIEEAYAALFAIAFMPEKIHYEVLKKNQSTEYSMEEFFLSNEKLRAPFLFRTELNAWMAALLYHYCAGFIESTQSKIEKDHPDAAAALDMVEFILMLVAIIPTVIWRIVFFLPTLLIDWLFLIPPKFETIFRVWEYCFEGNVNDGFYLTKRYCFHQPKRTVHPGWMIRWFL